MVLRRDSQEFELLQCHQCNSVNSYKMFFAICLISLGTVIIPLLPVGRLLSCAFLFGITWWFWSLCRSHIFKSGFEEKMLQIRHSAPRSSLLHKKCSNFRYYFWTDHWWGCTWCLSGCYKYVF